jgi:hypothetical protein
MPRLGTSTLTVLIIAAFYLGAQNEIEMQQTYPPGYTGFKGTGLIEYLKSLPADTPIISDKTAIIQYYLGRPAYPIQEFFSQQVAEKYLPYGSDPDDKAQQVFREEGGALVLFWMVHDEFKGLYGEQAGDRYAAFIAGLYVAYDAPEGKVFFISHPLIEAGD